jgi:hypothetical protein
LLLKKKCLNSSKSIFLCPTLDEYLFDRSYLQI